VRLAIPGITFGVLVACVAVDAATAQGRPALRAGARLRIWHVAAIPRAFTVGRLLTLDPGTLSIVPRGAFDPITIPFAAIDRLEWSRGRHPLIRFGLPALGALLGAWIAPQVMTEARHCATGLVRDSRCVKQTPDWLVGVGAGVVTFGVLGSFVPMRAFAPRPTVSVSVAF